MQKQYFFILDSDNLSEVEDRFLGFALMLDHDNIRQNDSSCYPAAGAFIDIHKENGVITLHQDLTGNAHLYLFRREHYFALGNSLYLLLDHLAGRFRLHLDKNYAGAFLGLDLASLSAGETIIEEIELLPKETVVHIDTASGELSLENMQTPPELSVPLDSEEGIGILDSWQQKWAGSGGIIRQIKERSRYIIAELSGGFDSRLDLAMLLCAGINLDEVCIYSQLENPELYGEDYTIATEIATGCGFELNRRRHPHTRHFSAETTTNLAFYTSCFEHKHLSFYPEWSDEPVFTFSGRGGEAFRRTWFKTPLNYISRCAATAGRTSWDLVRPVNEVLMHTLQEIRAKYNFESLEDPDLMVQVYRNARIRSHFGTRTVGNFLAHNIVLSPVMDYSLYQLQICDRNCPDPDLLYALIYERYCPKLLEFRFDRNRSIAPATREYARKLSAKYPLTPGSSPGVSLKIQELVPPEEVFVKVPVTPAQIEEKLKKVFMTQNTRAIFSQYFDVEIYRKAKARCEVSNLFDLANVYPVLGVVLAVLQCQRSALKFGQGVEGIFAAFELPEADKVSTLFSGAPENLITARIDLKNRGDDSNCIEILENSDPDAQIATPTWFKHGGQGYQIFSRRGELNLKLRCHGSGELQIQLRSKYSGRKKVSNLPFWLYYKELELNGTKIFDKVLPAWPWHDNPPSFTRPVQDGEELELRLTWMPDADTQHYLKLVSS